MLPALLLASLSLYLFYRYLLHPLFVSPLRHIPAAHWSARFSSLWILSKRFNSTQNVTVHAAHSQHGPVVLVAPNELVVNCVDNGIRTIYSGGFEKHDFYPNLFANYGIPNMFSTVRSGPHSIRKRMMSNIYSKSSVQTSRAFSKAVPDVLFGRLLPKIVASHSIALNARRLFEAATMDIVTAYLFGPENSSDLSRNDEEAEKWMTCYQSRRDYDFWSSELPGFQSVCARFGINLSPAWVADANHYLQSWCLRICDATESRMFSEDSQTSSSVPVVFTQLHSQLRAQPEKDTIAQNNPGTPKRLLVASEMLDHLSAGHETSSVTLSFLFHELSLRPSLQRRLRDELKALDPLINLDVSKSTPISPKQLDSLPLLHAVHMETLRLHAAIPGSEYRMTPTRPEGVTLGPYSSIPGGVRVSSSAFCLHRNEAVFPNAEKWMPERWLQNPSQEEAQEKARLQEQLRWFWAFSSGGRMCIGSHLAMAQMKAITATLIACFDVVRAAPLKDTAGAEPFELESPYLQQDTWSAFPIDEKLPLRFISVET